MPIVPAAGKVIRIVHDALGDAISKIIEERENGFIAAGKYSRVTNSKVEVDVYHEEDDYFLTIKYSSFTVDAEISTTIGGNYVLADIGDLDIGGPDFYVGVLDNGDVYLSEELIFINPYTGELTEYNLHDFIVLLELLSMSKWPGTDKSVVLKESDDYVHMSVSDKEILDVEETTGALVTTVFIAPFGRIEFFDDGKARMKFGDKFVEIEPSPVCFGSFASNYSTAIWLMKNRDILEEYGMLL